jgi:hypothetical protein
MTQPSFPTPPPTPQDSTKSRALLPAQHLACAKTTTIKKSRIHQRQRPRAEACTTNVRKESEIAMAKHHTAKPPQQRFTPGGVSAFDVVMANARELFPQPVKKPPQTDWPFAGQLEHLMKMAPEVSEPILENARMQVQRAQQQNLQSWLGDRQAILRARGITGELIGITHLELTCMSCGQAWLVSLSPVDTMLDDANMQCPRLCNIVG